MSSIDQVLDLIGNMTVLELSELKKKYEDKFGVTATVKEIEYDPNRSARLALIEFADGERRYILHPKGLSVGDTVVSGPGADTRTGNALPLREMPLGTFVHNIELLPGKGGQMARSAGMSAEVVAKAEKRHADEEEKRKQLAAGALGLDMYHMREALAKAGLVYVDGPEPD